MLARHRPTILVASATAAMVVGVFVAVSANSESAQSPPLAISSNSESAQRPALVQSAVLAESSVASAPEGSIVPTAAVAEPRRSARKANRQRRVVENVPPQPPRIVTPPHVPLILGIHF
jgi:hypothetical protein